jgi:hypothetical protein
MKNIVQTKNDVTVFIGKHNEEFVLMDPITLHLKDSWTFLKMPAILLALKYDPYTSYDHHEHVTHAPDQV